MVLGALVVVIVGVLVANYFKGVEQGKIPTNGPSTEVKVPTGGTTHQVEPGESLWTIAEFYYDSGYNWVDVANENGLAAPFTLEKGQTLEIPKVEPKLATVELIEVPQPISGATYTVEKGDSLWNIAVRAYGDGYRWVEIAEINNLKNPNLVHVGNVLSLPR